MKLNLKEKLVMSVMNIKKFINWFVKETISLKNHVKARFVLLHEFMRLNGWYKIVLIEFADIVVMGFFISLALVTFGIAWRPWLSLSYGLVPWVLIYIAKSAKRELRK